MSTLQGNTHQATGMSAFQEKVLGRGHHAEAAVPLAERPENANHQNGRNKKSNGQQNDGSSSDSSSDDDQPEGGWDPTPLPPASEETYIIKITFHSATRLPTADLHNLAADPYVLAQLDTPTIPPRHKEDPPLRFRGTTHRITREPKWEESWTIGGVPKEGGQFKIVIMDEDYMGKDDRLGSLKVDFHDLGSSNWTSIDRRMYDIKKRRASKRVNAARALRSVISPLDVFRDKRDHVEDQIEISIEIVGKYKPGDQGNVGRPHTLGPCRWLQHYSPLLGRMTGIKGDDKEEGKGQDDNEHEKIKKQEDSKGRVERYDFQANQIQLKGPTPSELYHRFVNFKWFVNGLFLGSGLRGRLLNRALHHQHARIYNYDKRTARGEFEQPDQPDEEVTRKFLELAHYDQGGRVFTFVLTLDAMFRFTETGEEFSIDLLSKHMMHSDVNVYIAWSGEFMVRRRRDAEPVRSNGNGDSSDVEPSKDPQHYELIIDNNSGTYRPKKELGEKFQSYMQKCLPGLKVSFYDCTDERLDKIKKQQKAAKEKQGSGMAYMQESDSDNDSISSSDASSFDSRMDPDNETGHSHVHHHHDKADQKRKKRTKVTTGTGLLEEPKKEIKSLARDFKSLLH